MVAQGDIPFFAVKASLSGASPFLRRRSLEELTRAGRYVISVTLARVGGAKHGGSIGSDDINQQDNRVVTAHG